MYSRFTLVRISINLNSSQLNMFREIILPIFRSTRLCVTACGVMHTPRCCRPKAGNILFHDVMWSDEAFPKSEGVFNGEIGHAWTWNNPHAIHERKFHKVRNIVGPYFPRDKLSAQRYRNLMKFVLLDCLKACLWPWSKGRRSSTLCGRCVAVCL